MEFRCHQQVDETSTHWARCHYLKRQSEHGTQPKHIQECMKTGEGWSSQAVPLEEEKEPEKGIGNNSFERQKGSRTFLHDYQVMRDDGNR